MEKRTLRKNVLDLRYQTAMSMSLKSLGLAFTVLVAAFTTGVTVGRVAFFGSVGLALWSALFLSFYLFHTRAEHYLDRIWQLEG